MPGDNDNDTINEFKPVLFAISATANAARSRYKK